MQQVQLVVGSLALAGSLIALYVSPWGLALTFIAGIGLIQAGITGICPMEKILSRMPWNAPSR